VKTANSPTDWGPSQCPLPIPKTSSAISLRSGLAPAYRAAFRLATSPECSGEGSAYRAIAKLWRSYFRPPSDTRGASWYGTGRK
jgi:hypothetical protein